MFFLVRGVSDFGFKICNYPDFTPFKFFTFVVRLLSYASD